MGKQAGRTSFQAAYAAMIGSGNYPVSIDASDRKEISEMWKKGKQMGAIQKLQALLTPEKKDKTLL